MERAEKREFVTELNEVFKASGSVVVAHYAGATVAQMNDFRSKMRAAGGTVKVAKNRLAKIALQGTEAEGMSNLFKGQTLIATPLLSRVDSKLSRVVLRFSCSVTGSRSEFSKFICRSSCWNFIRSDGERHVVQTLARHSSRGDCGRKSWRGKKSSRRGPLDLLAHA